MTILGVDLSYTGTGLAGWRDTPTGPRLTVASLSTSADWPRPRRQAAIVAAAYQRLSALAENNLVIVENRIESLRVPGSSLLDLAGLLDVLLYGLYRRRVPYTLVSNSTLKVYATGSGRASKLDVVRAWDRRRDADTLPEADDDNQADALWLACMAADAYGRPVLALPKTHRRALDSVRWPDWTPDTPGG